MLYKRAYLWYLWFELYYDFMLPNTPTAEGNIVLVLHYICLRAHVTFLTKIFHQTE